MRIGEIAARAGVPAKTIRFWEDQRLLPPPDRTPSGYRDYEPAVLERLAFIRHAQAAGLTLDAIRQVIEVRDGGQPPCVHVTALIARRLAEVQARLAELSATRDQLAALAGRAAAQDPADCRGYCSIITGSAPALARALDLPRKRKVYVGGRLPERGACYVELVVLTVPGCPNAAAFEERLAAVLAEHPGVAVVRRVIADEREAAQAGMHGSPTLLVNGADPFATPDQPPSLSCRLYRDASGRTGPAPSVQALRQALAAADDN